MYFLLPAREIANSTVNDFKSSLSQYSESNYYTVPLCNYKHPHPSDKSKENTQEIVSDVLGTKSIRKSNPAIKSKPVAQPPLRDEEDSLKCDLCGWNYPKSFAQQDKDSHYERCKNGHGETDKKLWSKCKSDRALFRKKIEAREETRNKGTGNDKEKERERERDRDKKERKREREQELEIEKKREEEREKLKGSHEEKPNSTTKAPITMEIESSENSDLDVPIQKKSNTLKRHDPSTQSQFIEVYDLEREDLKKVKKTTTITLPLPVAKMVGRKSATKAVFNPSSNTVYTID